MQQVLQGKQDGDGEVAKTEAAAVSPFVSKGTAHLQDLRREAIMARKSNGSPQTTPKRTMSPLKRFNKVAPSPVKPPNAAAMPSTAPVLPLISAVIQASSLQSNSASVFDERQFQHRGDKIVSEKDGRPGSAPLDNMHMMNREGGERKQNVAKPITLEPVIVVQSKNGDLVVQEWENEGNSNGSIIMIS